MITRLTVLKLAALSTAMLAPLPLLAQVRDVDRGVLMIMRGTETVGREEFVVRPGRGSGTLAGFTVVSTAWYPVERPVRSLSVVMEFGPDSAPTASRFEVGNGDLRRVIMGIGPRRTTVRSVTPTGESAREYPVHEPQVLLSDSLFASHALRPIPAAGAARILTLDGLRGPQVQVTDHGVAATSVGGSALRLRHLTITSPDEERHLWYDEDGRIMKVEVPSRRLIAYRSEGEGG